MIRIELTSSRGNFILYENEEPVIILKRSNWYSMSAEMVYFESLIEIKSQNMFGKKFDLLDSGKVVGELNIRMRNITIEIQGQNYKKHFFKLKRKGFFGGRFELFTLDGEHIATLRSKFNWSRFKFDYDIDVFNPVAEDLDLYELLTYCGYCATIYMKRRGSS